MYQEQIIDDANLKQEYDNCNTNDLQNEIITIKYEESSIKQKMKLLNNSFELQVSQKKLKELQFNQEQLNQYNKQIEKEKENQRSNLKKCDELLENTQYLRFQYEKKVLNQLTFRRTNTYYIKIGDAKSYKNYQQYDKKTVQTCIFKNNLTRQLRFKKICEKYQQKIIMNIKYFKFCRKRHVFDQRSLHIDIMFSFQEIYYFYKAKYENQLQFIQYQQMIKIR